MKDVQLDYGTRMAECLLTGHTPLEWQLGQTRRAWCSRCSRTWPIAWLRLLPMRQIECLEVFDLATESSARVN